MLTIPAVSRDDALTLLTGGTGPFDSPIVHLYQSAITPSPILALADLDAIECDFIGYAASPAITWGAIHFDALYNAVVLGGLVEFLCSDDTKPQDAYGYYLEVGGVLVGLEPFAAPLPCRKALDYVPVIPQMTFGQ